MTSSGNSNKKNKMLYPIFSPSSSDIGFSILSFRHSDNIDLNTVPMAKMNRENNLRDFRSAYGMDAAPKYGEGSQFGKEQKDEARRQKYGIRSKKYNPLDQPWLLNAGNGKKARKYKGIKCKDVMDNASYMAFTTSSNGTFLGLPIVEWCEFKFIPKYKTLSIEEAEEEFSRRDKVHNQYAIMLNKRKKDEADEVDGKTGGDNEGSIDGDSDEEKGKKAGGTKKKGGEDVEEDEDRGEFNEGQEMDYITDESSDGDDKKENEEEEEEEDESDDDDEDDDKKEVEDETNNTNNNKNSDSSDTSSDSDIDNDPHLPILVRKDNQSKRSHGESSNTVSSKKQKLDNSAILPIIPPPPSTSKKPTSTTTAATATTASPAKSTDSSSLEIQVRRYLLRKPMTSTDLIQKLRKTSSNKDKLMDDIIAVLMKINPIHSTVNDKLYFALKPSANNEEEAGKTN